METLGRIRVDKNVIDSLVFYFMLSIYLSSRGVPESIAGKSLHGYVAVLREESIHFRNPEVLGIHLETAYKRLPSEFLSIHDIPARLNDGIYTIDVNYGWVKKL